MTQEAALLSALFFAVAILYSSVGHAGASGYLAAMALVGTAATTMRPTALVLNVLVATLATVRFYRAGCFSWRSFWPFALTSIPLSFVGGAITLPATSYKRLVGAILLFSAARLLRESLRPADRPAERPETSAADQVAPHVPIPSALVCGAIIGLMAGLTGTGGGIFLSPLLLFLGWEETRKVSGVSAAFILLNSIAGILAKPDALQEVPAALPVWAGAAMAGGLIGTELGARRLATTRLRQLLAAVLIVAGLKLVAAV